MNEAAAIAIVKSGYEALERDDVPAFLALCDPGAVWVYPAQGQLSFGGTWRGRDGVKAFLEAHDAAEEILELRIDEMLVSGDTVAVTGVYRGAALPSRTSWETRFVHLITLNEGRWRRFEAFFDTAAAAAAHGVA